MEESKEPDLQADLESWENLLKEIGILRKRDDYVSLECNLIFHQDGNPPDPPRQDDIISDLRTRADQFIRSIDGSFWFIFLPSKSQDNFVIRKSEFLSWYNQFEMIGEKSSRLLSNLPPIIKTNLAGSFSVNDWWCFLFRVILKFPYDFSRLPAAQQGNKPPRPESKDGPVLSIDHGNGWVAHHLRHDLGACFETAVALVVRALDAYLPAEPKPLPISGQSLTPSYVPTQEPPEPPTQAEPQDKPAAPHAIRKPGRKRKAPTLDDYRKVMNENPNCIEWNSRQWGEMFNVTRQAIEKTEAWKTFCDFLKAQRRNRRTENGINDEA